MGWAGVIPGIGRGGHAGPRSPLNWPSTPLAEGGGIDGLLSHLIRSGICQLSDVRKNPLSHNHGFGGKTMARLRVDVNVAYIHVPALTADDCLFDLCEATILSSADDAMASVADPCTRKPSALMCFASCDLLPHPATLPVAEAQLLLLIHTPSNATLRPLGGGAGILGGFPDFPWTSRLFQRRKAAIFVVPPGTLTDLG